MPRSRWFRALSAADSVRSLWRLGVSCHVRVRTDDAEDARVVSSGIICSDVRSRPEVCPDHVMADFGKHLLLLFCKYSAVSQFPFAGITIPRFARESLVSKKITRTATTSWALFAASWVCHSCLPPTSRIVCKKFVRPSAMRWHGSYSSW